MKHFLCLMRNPLAVLLSCLVVVCLLVACGDDDEKDGDVPATTERTILMYYPWTGNTGALTGYFWRNIASMKADYENYGTSSERVVVFIATSGTQGYIFDINDYIGHGASALSAYTAVDNPSFTTVEGVYAILNAMRSKAPSTKYGLIIGCHGQGWIPTAVNNTANKVKGAATPAFRPHWTYGDGSVMTRLFGGTSARYQTDISTLAEALGRFGAKMDYILFDDCYMSAVEVAYDLRAVADYLVACPTEVLADGILSANVGRYLLGTPDYEGVCEQFRSHYASSSLPYGTISTIDCSEVDSLARVMKRINALYTYDKAMNDSLQRMDGYLPTIFFDMGDYAAHLCKDTTLLAEFNAQLARTVPYKAHTGRYPTTFDQDDASKEYSAVASGLYAIPIHTYSGLTIGEPTKYSSLVPLYPDLAWYKATH